LGHSRLNGASSSIHARWQGDGLSAPGVRLLARARKFPVKCNKCFTAATKGALGRYLDGAANAAPNHKEKFKMGVLGNIMSAIFGSKEANASTTKSAVGGAASNSSGTIDVSAILDNAVAAKKQKLEWRTSIVDLMKALDLDSSQTARKELAKDLHFDGDTNDSAKMNIWLHKQVMTKFAENGGKVPAELKA
jgi:hypothetical protein